MYEDNGFHTILRVWHAKGKFERGHTVFYVEKIHKFCIRTQFLKFDQLKGITYK